MSPLRTGFQIIVILSALFLLALVFPEEGIQLSEKVILSLPKPQKIFSVQKAKYKDISGIINNKSEEINDYRAYFIKLYHYPAVYYKNRYDNVKNSVVSENEPQKSKNASQPKPPIIYPLEYPDNNKAVLFPFFNALKNIKNSNELIRVLHYGDSQIEGDRITSYLRNELQKRFGGSGIGLFPVNIVSKYVLSIKHNISNNWSRYNVRDIGKSITEHNRMGIMLSYSRFTPVNLPNEKEVFESYINIKRSNISYALARKFTKCRLFYGFNRKPLVIEIFKNNELYDAEILLPNHELKINEWNFEEAGTELSIRFRGEDSPDVFGISLDNSTGVAVDNIPLRGSRGLDFLRTDLSFLSEMYNSLNVKLIILQFGVNLVPVMAKDYSYYEEKLYKELMELKNICHEIPIIIVGISDMSQHINGEYQTYPQIKLIREAQKNAAFKAGCIFWDTFKAMGGENSMPSWVFNNPPLARKDFTHFTYTGSKIIAQMFYNSLINEYDNYVKNNLINQ